MSDNKLHLGYSPLSKRIYLGRQNGDCWSGDKRDVTNEFLQVMEHKFPINTVQNVSVNGENKYRVFTLDMTRKVVIDGKAYFDGDDESPATSGKEDLETWFGLSYSSFAVIPRVLMSQMPEEWQGKMAALLNEFSDSFDTSDIGVDSVQVTAKSGHKFTQMPEFILNYRHPDLEAIDGIKKNKGKANE